MPLSSHRQHAAPRRTWPRGLGVGLVGLALCWPALAQDASASREREALRRVQSALQQAQQQRDALQAEKATLERGQVEQAALAQKQQIQANARSSRLRTLEREQDTLRAQLATGQAALAALRESTLADQAQAEARLAAASRQAAQWRGERDERTATNRALVARLEAATQALTEAQQRNLQMHAVGQEAIQRLRSLTPTERALLDDPILGLTAVRIGSEAEDLLLRLDAQRQPPAAWVR